MTRKEFINQIYFESRPYKRKKLTVNHLKKANLLPKTKIQIHDRVIWLSNAYVTYKKEIAYVGFVETNKGLLARTFFFSRSQAVGRVLIGYRFSFQNGVESVTHNEKGHDEQSISLPIEVQEQMALQSTKFIKVLNSDFFFYGTVSDYKNLNSYKQVRKKPVLLAGQFYEANIAKLKPERLKFEELADYPDFMNPIGFWTLNTELYGPLRVFVFLSFSKKLIYQFNVTHKNYNWLASIQLNRQKISSCGVKYRWVDCGYLGIPFYEYKLQSFGFGSLKGSRSSYVDMNSKFLRKVPIFNELKKLLDCKKAVSPRQNVPIRRLGSYKYFGADGNLKVKLSVDNIKSKWRPPISYILERLKKIKSVKSVYVRGSVADGTAQDNIADLDIVYCSERNLDLFEKKIALDFKKKFGFVERVEFLRFSEEDATGNSRSAKRRYIQMLLKTQCVHLFGRDFSELIREVNKRKDFLCHLPYLRKEYQLMQRRISYHEMYGDVEAQNRWFSKRIVRSGFELVLKLNSRYTRDLYCCFSDFAKFFPQQRYSMYLALKNCLVGRTDVRDFEGLINFIDNERKRLWPEIKS